MIENIRHVGMEPDRFEWSLEFYLILGFKAYYVALEDWATGVGKDLRMIAKLKSDHCDVAIELVKKLCTKYVIACGQHCREEERVKAHISLTVTDLDGICDIIKHNRGKVVVEPRESPDKSVRVAFCEDPNGFLLELVEEIK